MITAKHDDWFYMIGFIVDLDKAIKVIEASKLMLKFKHNTKDHLTCENKF